MLDAVCKSFGQQAAASFVQVQPVSPEKMPSFPESIKVADEAHVVRATHRGKAGVEVKQSSETPHTSAAGGGGARDVNTPQGLFDNIA